MADEDLNREPPCSALLYFSGDDFDPDSMLPLVRATLARIRKKGQEMVKAAGSAPILAKRGYCSFSTANVLSHDINDHVAVLLSSLEPHADRIKTLVRDNDLEWGIVCFFDDPLKKNHWSLTDDNQHRAAALTIPIINETISRTMRIVENIS